MTADEIPVAFKGVSFLYFLLLMIPIILYFSQFDTPLLEKMFVVIPADHFYLLVGNSPFKIVNFFLQSETRKFAAAGVGATGGIMAASAGTEYLLDKG
jgi:hypothetical protein